MLESELATQMRATAASGAFDGTQNSILYLRRCKRTHEASGTVLVYSRDEVPQSWGPTFDRCWHLSLSFVDPETSASIPKDEQLTETWLDLFFGKHKDLILCEPPKSAHGKLYDVWHYRLFYDASGNLTLPVQVDGIALIPDGWMTYGEVRAGKDKAN